MEARQLMGDPDSDDTQAPLLLGLSGGVLLLALLLLFIRLVSRLRPTRVLKSEDWVISVSAVLAIVNFILLTFACSFGLGRRAKFVPAANQSITLRLVFTAQLSFYWALTLVKISVALLLLRFKSTPRWRNFLYFTIGILVLTTIAQTLFQVLQCQPFSIYWDPSVASRVKCVPMAFIVGMIVANSTVHVTTDILFSLMPICFIRKLNRPRNEKIFLGILMGLGLFASTFAILRTAGLKNFGASGDFFKENVMATLWANMELEIAMIAATMPTLKSFMESALVKVGTKFYEKDTESQIRGRLVHMGFLAEDEAMSDSGEYGAEKTPKILHVEKVIAGLDGTAKVPGKDRRKREKQSHRDVGLDKCRDPD